jgi:SAM-dependent methyltransferase
MGADHLEWAKYCPRSLTGIDLTERAISFTRDRLLFHGLRSELIVADAENLPFGDNAFDLVYSFGVLHHSPDTTRAIQETFRVLRHGGQARIMIYHRYSMVGYMLWAKYALLAGRPGRTLSDIYANHLESPGTKAFTLSEAEDMFSRFSSVNISTRLSFGDLLKGEVGQQHRGALTPLAKSLYPRWLIRSTLPDHGLYMMITVVK